MQSIYDLFATDVKDRKFDLENEGQVWDERDGYLIIILNAYCYFSSKFWLDAINIWAQMWHIAYSHPHIYIAMQMGHSYMESRI